MEDFATHCTSAIKDNRSRGKVGDFLKESIKDDSTLSIVSAYFTIYAFEKLKNHLHKIDHLNFLFGEPRFVKNLDPDRTDKKAFKIEDEKLALSNRLQQKCLAKECADWITDVPPEKQAPIVALVEQILAAKKHVGANGVRPGSAEKSTAGACHAPLQERPTEFPTLEAEIDRLVYALYGLTEEEITVVEGKKS